MLRLVVVRAEYGLGIASNAVREVAITLVREPGEVQDIIMPKRSGVGITFETVSHGNCKAKSVIMLFVSFIFDDLIL